MTADGRATLMVKLDRARPVPAGQVVSCDERWFPFDGWLQLLAALEAAIGPAAPTASSAERAPPTRKE